MLLVSLPLCLSDYLLALGVKSIPEPRAFESAGRGELHIATKVPPGGSGCANPPQNQGQRGFAEPQAALGASEGGTAESVNVIYWGCSHAGLRNGICHPAPILLAGKGPLQTPPNYLVLSYG